MTSRVTTVQAVASHATTSPGIDCDVIECRLRSGGRSAGNGSRCRRVCWRGGGTCTASVASSKSAWRSRASTISARHSSTVRASYCGSSVDGADDASLRDDDDDEPPPQTDPDESCRRRVYVVCPKCVLMRHARPERLDYPWTFCGSASSSLSLRRRRPICNKWHNLGSWARVITGDYRVTALGLDAAVPGRPASPTIAAGPSSLSDYDHPRLSATINDHPRLFATVCDCRRSSATILRRSATVDEHLRLFATVCDC